MNKLQYFWRTIFPRKPHKLWSLVWDIYTHRDNPDVYLCYVIWGMYKHDQISFKEHQIMEARITKELNGRVSFDADPLFFNVQGMTDEYRRGIRHGKIMKFMLEV